ncbi:MAG: hypothetical protein P8H25_06870 [Flavobacteriaceae bacterium]|nr:hypothetical protein [Flavobacteriaceae bacterium]
MKQLFLFFALLATTFSSAQLFDDLANLLKASEEDYNILADAYTAPLGQSLTHSLSNGWLTTAKTHKKLGVDFTIGLVYPRVPDAAKKIDIEGLGLTSLTSDKPTASSIFGPSQSTDFTYTLPGTGIDETVTMPGGIEDDLISNSFITPYAQLGVGLFFDTDLIVRYVPNIENSGVEFSMYGFGLKHNLMQYFGPLDKLPLNVSALASYSKLSSSYELSSANPDQKVTYDVGAFLTQLTASIDLPIVSVMAGFGYSKGTANMDMLGNYTVGFVDNTNISLNDPISIEQTYTGTHGVVGIRFSFFVLKTFVQYTIQEYNTLNFGVSFSFR